jgi:fucose permease
LKQSYLRIAIAFSSFALIGANSGAAGVVLPGLSRYYQVDKSVVGLLFLASSTGYFLSAFSSSLLLEKLGPRKFLLMGTLTFLLGTLTIGLKPPFVAVLTTRLFLGFGIAIIETGLNAYVVALPRSTSLLNSLHAFYGAGALLGPVIAATILTLNCGWNSVYLIWTLLSFPLLLGFAIVFSHQLPAASTRKEEEATTGNVLTAALRLPMVWWASLFLLLYVGIEVSLGTWGYSFLVEGRHQQAWLSSLTVSGYWLGLTLGRFTLSNFAERLGIGNVGLIYSCMAGIVIGVLIIWLFPFEVAASVGFCFIGYSLGPIYPTMVALMPDLVASRLVSSAISFLVSMSILGIAIFPWLAGILAQSISTWSLLPYTIVLTFSMLVSWWIMFRSSTKPPPVVKDLIATRRLRSSIKSISRKNLSAP